MLPPKYRDMEGWEFFSPDGGRSWVGLPAMNYLPPIPEAFVRRALELLRESRHVTRPLDAPPPYRLEIPS